MAYRDVDHLLARIAELEGERLRVRARANRYARRLRAERRAWLWRVAAVLLLVPIACSAALFWVSTCSYRGPSWRSQARYDTLAIHPVAEKWRVDRGDGSCPTVARLIEEKELSGSASYDDHWGRPYVIVCDGPEELRVVSAGPDGELFTADDIETPSR